MNPSDYQLLDFGFGEKLERFGKYVVRRANLYARRAKNHPDLWNEVDLEYDEGAKVWINRNVETEDWRVQFGKSSFSLKPTPVGHLGIFPEQHLNWTWIDDHIKTRVDQRNEPLRALNLFAYTGGTTMALAGAGVEVVHLDGAANTVKWARGNASHSGLGGAPIRWIVEDTMRFLEREVKRGNQYDVFVADPPSFGRGPKKEQWRIQRDFPAMIDLLPQLLPEPTAIILSCHTEGFGTRWMADQLSGVVGEQSGWFERLQLNVSTVEGKKLESGDCVRWLSNS
jgi:23S rRNA (cytosine1962-C5)-methyltransferase